MRVVRVTMSMTNWSRGLCMGFGSCVFSWSCVLAAMMSCVRGWKTVPDIITVRDVARADVSLLHNLQARFTYSLSVAFLLLYYQHVSSK